MGWFANLFAPSASTSRKGTINSTHDAFSLPTHSPGLGPMAADYGNPDPDSVNYTYPPPSSARDSYEFMSSPTTARARPGASLLPLHNMSSGAYPPLAQTWGRLRAWLASDYPELGDTLNYGILPADLGEIEMSLGVELPSAVRESYLQCDGQEPESSSACMIGLFFGLTLLPLEDVLEEWRFWREVDDDPNTGANPRLRESMNSVPPNWIRKEYSSRGWIPLVTDRAGNYLGVDLNPGDGGAAGQVIVFGREIDTKVVLWRGDGPGGWGKWLASFVDELEAGEGFEFGGRDNEVSEESDDGLGYEGYFYDGTGRGQGDGGGDAGSGGLRLTGDYKGWDVLHAWADRSARKWQEAGQVPETSTDASTEKVKMGLGVIDLEQSEPESSTAGATSSSKAASDTLAEPKPGRDRSHAPRVSISKAPAPKPVGLPTEQDIFTGENDVYSPVEDDVEAGRGLFMQELDGDRHGSMLDSQDPASVPLPPSHVVSPAVPEVPTGALADVTDELDNQALSRPKQPPLIPAIAIQDQDGVAVVGEGNESPLTARVGPAPQPPAVSPPVTTVSPAASAASDSEIDSIESPSASDEFEEVDASEVDEMGRRTDAKTDAKKSEV